MQGDDFVFVIRFISFFLFFSIATEAEEGTCGNGLDSSAFPSTCVVVSVFDDKFIVQLDRRLFLLPHSKWRLVLAVVIAPVQLILLFVTVEVA